MRHETVFHYKISSDYAIAATLINFSAGFASGGDRVWRANIILTFFIVQRKKMALTRLNGDEMVRSAKVT